MDWAQGQKTVKKTVEKKTVIRRRVSTSMRVIFGLGNKGRLRSVIGKMIRDKGTSTWVYEQRNRGTGEL